MPGISDNIRVISIVDKFLEHSRIAYFQNGDEPEVFLASADWMPRNFRRRVEIMFPIESPRLRRRLVDGILGVVLVDNVKARELQPDGTYRRVPPPGPGEPLDPLAGRVPEHGDPGVRDQPHQPPGPCPQGARRGLNSGPTGRIPRWRPNTTWRCWAPGRPD